MKKSSWLSCLIIFLALFVHAEIYAANINIVPYMGAGEDGGWWKYTYTRTPPNPVYNAFTLKMTLITSGEYQGKTRWGTWRYPDGKKVYYIFSRDTDHLYIYSENGTKLDPPVVIEGWQILNKIIPNPANPESSSAWYLKRQASLTVPAGTFKDVLVKIDLDKDFAPNEINDLLGLDRAKVPYAVTHVEWHAYGVGELLNIDLDAASGSIVYVYKLTSTNMHP